MWHLYSASGNSFLITKEKSSAFSSFEIVDLANRFKVDGVIFAEILNGGHYRMVYFNCDGSSAAMCGNGLRSVAHFVGDADCIETEIGSRIVKVQRDEVEVEIAPFPKISLVTLEGTSLFYMCTGVPHVIVPVVAVAEIDVEKEGYRICHHSYFAPEQTNVTFVEKNGKSLRIRTYERGVYSETLSCGTGAASAAALYFLSSSCHQVEIYCRSNEKLCVFLKGQNLFLRGSVQYLGVAR